VPVFDSSNSQSFSAEPSGEMDTSLGSFDFFDSGCKGSILSDVHPTLNEKLRTGHSPGTSGFERSSLIGRCDRCQATATVFEEKMEESTPFSICRSAQEVKATPIEEAKNEVIVAEVTLIKNNVPATELLLQQSPHPVTVVQEASI